MPPPQFFDIFGLICFIYLIVLSLLCLADKKNIPRVMFIVLFFIGLLGLIIDGLMVYQFYLK